jgi:hypothetical protein
MVHVSDYKLTAEQIDCVKKYFTNYCDVDMSMGVHWGTTSEFMTELRQRWEEYSASNPPA